MSEEPCALTVFVTGAGELPDAVRTVVTAWAGEGLVEPSAWIEATGATDHGAGGEVPAVLIAGSDAREATLFEHVADHAYGVIRLMALIPATSALPAEAGPVRLAVRLGEQLHRRLGKGQRLVRVVVVIPDGEEVVVDAGLFQPSFDANVVVAPEDRTDDRQAAAPVTGDRFAHHSALAAANLGGLWRGQDGGPFDSRSAHSLGNEPEVVVVRSFARLVEAGFAVDEVTANVLDAGARWPLPAGFQGEPAPNPAALVQSAADELLAVHTAAFGYRRPAPPATPGRPRLGLLNVLKLLLRRFRDALHPPPIQLPLWANDPVLEHLDDIALRSAGDIPGASPSAEQPGETAERILVLVDGNTRPAPQPRAWQDLRQACYGLVDGGPLPEGIATRAQTPVARLIVQDPRLVAPNPGQGGLRLPPDAGEVFPALAGSVEAGLRPCDPLPLVLLGRGWKAPEQETAGDSPPGPSRQAEIAGVIDAWAGPRRPSLCWRVGEGIAGALLSAQRDLGATLGELRAGREDPNVADESRELERRWRRWRNVWLVVLLVGLALGCISLRELGWHAGSAVWWSAWRVGLEAGAAGVIVALCALYLCFYRYQRRAADVLWRRWCLDTAFTFNLLRLEHAARSVVRLSAAYEQFLDWAEIVGWVVHRPWGDARTTPPASAEGSVEVPIRALEIVRTALAPKAVNRLSGLVRRQVMGHGWLTAAYGSATRPAMGALADRWGLRPEEALPDPDADVTAVGPGSGSETPRSSLLGWIRAESGTLRSGIESLVGEQCAEAGPSVLEGVGALTGAGSGFLGGIVSAAVSQEGAAAFVATLWCDDALITMPSQVASTVLWAPRSLVPSELSMGDKRCSVRPFVPSARPGERLVVGVVRVDLAQPAAPKDLRVVLPPTVLRSEPREEPTPIPIQSNGAHSKRF